MKSSKRENVTNLIKDYEVECSDAMSKAYWKSKWSELYEKMDKCDQKDGKRTAFDQFDCIWFDGLGDNSVKFWVVFGFFLLEVSCFYTFYKFIRRFSYPDDLTGKEIDEIRKYMDKNMDTIKENIKAQHHVDKNILKNISNFLIENDR